MQKIKKEEGKKKNERERERTIKQEEVGEANLNVRHAGRS